MIGRIGSLLFMRRTLPLAWRLLKDRRVPFASKLIIPGGLLYTVFPLDLMPDFFPGLGQLDDVTVILLSLMLFVRSAPKAVVRDHLERMMRRPQSAEPREENPGKIIDGDFEVLE